MRKDSPIHFRERLWPSTWLMIILLLLLPAVTLIVTPLNAALAVPIAVGTYVVIAGSLLLMAPKIEVTDTHLMAGNAKIPVAVLGTITPLNSAALRRTIGPGADARAFLLVRGHIHQALKIDVNDPADPTPYWVVTSRRLSQLEAAIDAARQPAQ